MTLCSAVARGKKPRFLVSVRTAAAAQLALADDDAAAAALRPTSLPCRCGRAGLCQHPVAPLQKRGVQYEPTPKLTPLVRCPRRRASLPLSEQVPPPDDRCVPDARGRAGPGGGGG
jgi:hypothetical protein